MSQTDRILFVDDDAPVRTAFKRSLRGHGFTIDLAEGPDEALQLVQQNAYAVIATDYRMPKVNGLELVEQMQTLQPDATYMLVSGECDLDLALEAVNEHQISYVVCKPWDTEELGSVLKRSMEASWERSGQRDFQRSMVEASRHLDAQKEKLSEAMSQAEQHISDTLLATLDLRGHETTNHCRRVAAYSMLIAEQLGVKGRLLHSIERGALLHDVGKITIPDSILLKAGPLSAEEWCVMRTHPRVGAQLLEGFDSLGGARQIVQQHHERWDGTGYPAGLRGDQICLGARIFAVADTLDAILSDRPYRQRLDPILAVAEVSRCVGTQFDPQVVAAFKRVPVERLMQVIEQFPDSRARAA